MQPAFPSTFTAGQSTYALDIPKMMLMIGYLTTPISSTGVSLSEFWAWVRYLAAISDQPHLSVTRSFWDLDAHQKTILSDDFGMGVPMLFLHDRLSFARIVDGRYFMQRIASSLGATQARTAKRGPNKTPDFVAQDFAGMWHVIECKGTQSGSEYSLKQLGVKGPPPEAGVAQKLSIQFPPGFTGQRLVCGLSIDVEDGSGSLLKIIDPEPKKPFVLRAGQMNLAQDAANRGVMAQSLRMAGLEVTAEAVASPLGNRPDDKWVRTSEERSLRKRAIEDREKRSREEIRGVISTGQSFDGDFRGRETVVVLPRELSIDGQAVRRVVIRQGVSRDVLQELEQKPSVKDLADDGSRVTWAGRIGKATMDGQSRAATMSIGSIFRMSLELNP
jgi:hypothetical protein